MSLPFVFLFIFSGGGAADAKLMGAIGMWLGARNGVVALAAVLLAGAVLGLLYALSKRRLQAVLLNLSLAGFGIAQTNQREWHTSRLRDTPSGLES